MEEKELRKLSRAELLEMLIDKSMEADALREKLEAAEDALNQKKIMMDQAGSIAEASLQLSGIFNAAQEACATYIENIRLLNERQEQICSRMEEETRIKCDEMIAKAEYESQTYWDEVHHKLEAYYVEHKELKKLLDVIITNKTGI